MIDLKQSEENRRQEELEEVIRYQEDKGIRLKIFEVRTEDQ